MTWEYRVITVRTLEDDDHFALHKRNARIEKLLSEMGEQGWELVSFLPAYTPTRRTETHHAIFKRARGEEVSDGAS